MRSSIFHPALVVLTLAGALTACASNDPLDEAASPVQTVTRTDERLNQSASGYTRRGEDGAVITRVLAPAPQVWEALKAAMEARNVKFTILDRPAGRMGDTAMVLMRKWAEHQGSYYFSCGQTQTGQRADEDRLRAVFLAQLTRLRGDTIAVAVHLSAFAIPIAMGSSGATAQCSSTGRGESDVLDEVRRRLGAR